MPDFLFFAGIARWTVVVKLANLVAFIIANRREFDVGTVFPFWTPLIAPFFETDVIVVANIYIGSCVGDTRFCIGLIYFLNITGRSSIWRSWNRVGGGMVTL